MAGSLLPTAELALLTNLTELDRSSRPTLECIFSMSWWGDFTLHLGYIALTDVERSRRLLADRELNAVEVIKLH